MSASAFSITAFPPAGGLPPVGQLLREWRQRRRMSQLELACEADVSARHLSFVESGRARPSREMVLHLAERLDIPLRERNTLLLAAGFAPAYAQRALSDPAQQAARDAIAQVLAAHEPYPALAVDRHWTMVMANRAVAPLLEGISAALLAPPVNVLRLSLHPDGLAPRIVNLAVWRAHLLARLERQRDASGDPALAALLDELLALPAPPLVSTADHAAAGNGLVVPLKLAVGEHVLSFISTVTVFGTPVDVALSELALETFFPADAASAAHLRALA